MRRAASPGCSDSRHRQADEVCPSRNTSHPLRYFLTRLSARFNVVIVPGDDCEMICEQAPAQITRGMDYETIL
jgi:hypothetical protein